MRERGKLGWTAAGAIALLLAGSATPGWAAPPPAKKVVVKKAVKKPVRKPTKKKPVAKKTPLSPILIDQVLYTPAPLAPPVRLGFDAPAGAYRDVSRYRYVDDADALLDTVGASPPDFGFRYDGIDGWAWQLSGGELVLAEPVGDHYRFYAFAAGEAYPFFVGDDAYSYGFEGRALAAVYGGDGS